MNNNACDILKGGVCGMFYYALLGITSSSKVWRDVNYENRYLSNVNIWIVVKIWNYIPLENHKHFCTCIASVSRWMWQLLRNIDD